MSQIEREPRITVKIRNGLKFIDVADVVRFYSDTKYTMVETADHETYFLAAENSRNVSLSTLEQRDHLAHFVRGHRSQLLNRDHIDRFVKTRDAQLVMSNGTTVPVSRRHIAAVRRLLREVAA